MYVKKGLTSLNVRKLLVIDTKIHMHISSQFMPTSTSDDIKQPPSYLGFYGHEGFLLPTDERNLKIVFLHFHILMWVYAEMRA